MSIKHIEENGPKWQIKKKGEESSILNRHNQGIVAIKKFYHRNSAYCVTPPNGKKKKKKKNPNAIGKFLFQKTTVSCQVLKLELSMKPR